jgi:NAD(P)H dehydrogenase (quinone)
MAKIMEDAFKTYGAHVDVRRVASFGQEEYSKQFPFAEKFYERICAVPEVDIKKLVDYDTIVIVSPAYFGNVSADIKVFMDSLSIYWLDRTLAGKVVVPVVSAASETGGGDITLQCITTFAQHMGMIAYPSQTLDMPAYGLLHIAGSMSEKRPTDNEMFINGALALASSLVKHLG